MIIIYWNQYYKVGGNNMNIKNTLEKTTKQVIVNKVINYLEKNPEKNIDKIFEYIKMLTKEESALKQIEFVE